ncbi:MAG: response regulator [Nitrospirae bacterium]|nr:response regulator [Nitrospirota bacterium]
MSQTILNPNCLITQRLGFEPYARCSVCRSTAWECLGMQYNLVVLLVFSAAMFLLLIDSNFIHRFSVLAILVVMILLGSAINRNTNRLLLSAKQLEEEVDTNRDLANRLQKAAGFLQNLLNSSTLAIIASDTECMITHWNKGAERLLGYTDQETVGWTCPAILRIGDCQQAIFSKDLTQAALHEGTLEDERVFVARDGTPFPVLLTLTHLAGSDGRLLGFLAIARDLRQQKVLEEQVRQSERLSAIGQLSAGMAHELNNALTPILAYSELLSQKCQGQERNRADLMLKAALRAKHITDGLLRFSRGIPSKRDVIDPNRIMEDALDIVQYRLETENIQVAINLDEDLPMILADAQQIQQVIINILNNARDSLQNHPAPRIRMRTHKDADGVSMVVENNGPEIPKAIIKRLFDPFFTTKEVGKGTGLGLSISYGIVTEHGGQIRVESNPEQTAFILWFPAAQNIPLPRKTQEAVSAQSPPSGLRILVVDDETAVLELLWAVFKDTGDWLDIANNGHDAMRFMADGRYDVVLSDIRMPGLSGKELYEWMAQHRPDLLSCTAFLTGDAISPDIQAFLKRVKRPHLLKPFRIAELLILVRELARGGS